MIEDTRLFLAYLARHNQRIGELAVEALDGQDGGVLDLEQVKKLDKALREASERCAAYIEKHTAPMVVEARQDAPVNVAGETDEYTP